LDAGPLGQFKLPVTITPFSRTTFFIDPVNGDDNFPGTASQPWATVESVLDILTSSGRRVAEVAGAGNDVVVTILGGTSTEPVQNDIDTPTLLAGSVTVLQAPFKKTFTLDLAANNVSLTLNKGYKLQDIKITAEDPSGSVAVSITHPTAGLASVDVTCRGTGVCVEVTGPGSHTLKDVRVDVEDADVSNIGILNDANLSIIGGRVRPIGGSNNAITLIDSQGVLTATGLTVDMTNEGHTLNSTGIVLNAAGSLVTGSTIKVSYNAGAIGIRVLNNARKSTVEGNTFIASGKGIGVKGDNNLFSSALRNNNFEGTFTNEVLP
jgi:hypothetical protein